MRYLVEMYNTNSQVTVEEWEFTEKNKAKDWFECCKNQFMEKSDMKHTAWILALIDSDENYWQLDVA